MDFEHFSISRDLFYLASLFAGAGLGCFLAALSSVRRGRSGWISAALCFLSCAVAALSGSIILSMGAVFKAFPLFVPSAVFFAAGVLALRFPRAGFALVFLAGVFAVFSGAAFLRHPRLADNSAGNLVMTLRSTGGGILIRKPRDSAGRPGEAGLPAPANRPSNPAGADAAETWNLAEDASPQNLYFEALAVQAHPLFPVFGGERRGFFSGAGRGNETLFSVKTIFFKAPAASSSSLSAESSLPETGPSIPGFSPHYFRVELPIRVLFPGMQFSVVFSGTALEFDPALPDDF
ncbi:MAG: hypothetical protein LBP69_09685 [Treponema sp.]|jgi:hypothetical protein|nr:hypothetical protein [Treponema sp.]